jgi:hypothetical protein
VSPAAKATDYQERLLMWEFRTGVGIVSLKRDFVGYDVEGSDGHSIGKVDKSSWDAGTAYLVVDTGFSIFGKRKRVIPAGLVERVDVAAEKIFVDLSKDVLKAAPDFDDKRRAQRRQASPQVHHSGALGDPPLTH